MPATRIVPIPFTAGPMHLNAYLLLGERVVIVDTLVAGQAERILAALAEEGRTPDEVSLILLTHGHGDHAGSAAALRERTAAPVALGAGDEEKCRTGVDLEMRGRGFLGRQMLKAIRARHQQQVGEHRLVCEPDLVLDGPTPLAPYGVDGLALPTPGHTRGSLSVFLKDAEDERNVIVGDLIVAGRGGPKLGIFASDENAMAESVREILRTEPKLVYASHAKEPFTLEEMVGAFDQS